MRHHRLVILAALATIAACASSPPAQEQRPTATAGDPGDGDRAPSEGHKAHGNGHEGHGHAHEGHGNAHDGHGEGHGDGHEAHGDGHRAHATHGHGHGGPAPLAGRFEDADRWARHLDTKDRDSWQLPAHVITLMNISEGMTVADIGAGTGYFVPHLSGAVGANGTVLALDIEPDMVRFLGERSAREKLANVRPGLVEVADPKLPADAIDRAIIVNTWHHIPGRTHYATKIRAGLKPGGAVYIVDFTLESPSGPPVRHRLAPAKVIAELEAGGLEASLISETLPRQYVVVGKRPL